MTVRSGLVICFGIAVVLLAIVLIPTHAHAPRVLIGFLLGALTFLAADAAGRYGARRR